MEQQNPIIDAQKDFEQVLTYSLDNGLNLGVISVDLQEEFLKNVEGGECRESYLVDYHREILKLSESNRVPSFVYSYDSCRYGKNLLVDKPYIKSRNSCFYGTDLEDRINHINSDLLFTIGIFAESCVFETLIDSKIIFSQMKVCTSLNGVERRKLMPHMMYQICQEKVIDDLERICEFVLK